MANFWQKQKNSRHINGTKVIIISHGTTIWSCYFVKIIYIPLFQYITAIFAKIIVNDSYFLCQKLMTNLNPVTSTFDKDDQNLPKITPF
jgi:hypothetical protein